MKLNVFNPAWRPRSLLNYVLFLLTASSHALANEMEEVVVQASLLHRNADTGATPLHVVDEERLSSEPTLSLGETLDGLLGVSTADYGSGVGQPVIRGMSGNRVRVLQNGHVTRDISGLGGDHINEVMLENAQQIEVVRGPASLLFANGTIGGIVNVVDQAIAQTNLTSPRFSLSTERQTVNDGEALSLDAGHHLLGLNWHYEGSYSNFNAYDVPDGAIDPEPMHEEAGDAHDEPDNDHALSVLENSDTRRNNHRVGVSKAGDWGYVGGAFTQQESVYGIPVHADAHEADLDHEEDLNHDDEHGEERIFSATQSRVWSLEGQINRALGPIRSINFSFQDSEYKLTEQHAEAEHSDDVFVEEEGPTLFTNDARELSVKLNLDSDIASHRVVVNLAEEAVAIVGEEAFMLPTESKEVTMGYYFSQEWPEGFHFDLGARFDSLNRKGQVANTETHEEDGHQDATLEEGAQQAAMEIEPFDVDFSTSSLAISLSRDFGSDFSVSLGLASVERAPSVVEMFINGPHLAAQRFEVGDARLHSERGFNTEINLSYEGSTFFWAWTLFNNNVSDYIYLRDEREATHEAAHDELDHGGLILATYEQENASFTGYEFELGTAFDLSSGTIEITYGRDQTRARLDSGSSVPRIAPTRDIVSLTGRISSFSTRLSYQRVHAQTDVAENELATAGYNMLNLSVTRTFSLGTSTLEVSLFGRNLLDDIARRHTSFVKEEAPLPGRNLGLKLAYKL